MSVMHWETIWANSSMIQYGGEWNTTTYQPLGNGSSASLNFTGSGIGLVAYGNAGDRTDQGLLFQIDANSTSPYNTTILLDFTPRNQTDGGQWVAKFLPPGEHQVEVSTKWATPNVTFTGFDVLINATIPDPIVWNQTLSSDEVEFYGSQDENNGTTYAVGAGSGFGFNFTGVGVMITAQESFEVDTPYSVYFNVSAPPDSSVVPFARYPGKAGPANQIFFAGDLPQGEHKVVVVNEGERLGLRQAMVLLPNYYNNVSQTCWSGCKADDKDKSTGIGVSYEDNGAMGRSVGWSVLVGLGLVASYLVTL